MTKALSIRLPDELAAEVEQAASSEGRSLNTEIVRWLERGKVAPSELQLSVTLLRSVVSQSVLYHVKDAMGLIPVITTDEELADWAKHTLMHLSGLEDENYVIVTVDGDNVVIRGTLDIIEAIQYHIA